MFFIPTFEEIMKLQHIRNCRVQGVDAITSDNNLFIEGTKIHLQFRSMYNDSLGKLWGTILPEFVLTYDHEDYIVPSGYSNLIGNLICDSFREQPQDLSISINEIKQPSLVDDQQHFWRYVYPIEGDPWFLKINAISYHDDSGTTSMYALLRPMLDSHQMVISRHKIAEQEYMIIDSAESCEAEEMEHRVHALITALGYITGRRYGNHRYILTATDSNYQQITGIGVMRLQETRYSNYRIFETRRLDVLEMLSRYEYQKYAKDEIASEEEKVTWFYDDNPMSIDALSKMATLCYTKSDMLIAASMLLDGSMLPIEYQKPFYHVALEVITSSIMDDDKLKPQPPMSHKGFQKNVLPILKEALDSITDIPDEARTIYSNRLQNSLNQAANQTKLTEPFERLGYIPTEADVQAIKLRNKSFHGHISRQDANLKSQQEELFAHALRLHKLCGILLFKASGYTGKILNNEVLFGIEDACINRKEHAYVEI